MSNVVIAAPSDDQNGYIAADSNGDGSREKSKRFSKRLSKRLSKSLSFYDGHKDAEGYSMLGAGRGAISMANLFLNQSLLTLAYEAAGCELGEQCQNKVYGFYPSSWISNIPVIAGVTSAVLMPFFGAVVDHTDYRRGIGIFTAAFLTVVQAVQIYTVLDTWFVMTFFQALAIVLYFTQLVAIYAYLPEIGRDVGENVMAGFTGKFQGVQFGVQFLFLVIIAVVTFFTGFGAVTIAQISQGLVTLACLVFFGLGWGKYIQKRKARRIVPEGSNMFKEAIKNNWATIKSMQKTYKKGMRWFFLAITFSQAAAQTAVSVANIYLTDTLKMGTLEIIGFFASVLLVSLLGCPLGAWVSRKTNAKVSYQIGMIYFFLAISVGALVLEMLPFYCVFIWGAFVGIAFGWFYATEPLFFSMILPEGQEAELAGFYMNCSTILMWLPPLFFTLIIEANIAQKYAVIITVSFFLLAVLLLMCGGSWEEMLEEAKVAIPEAASNAASKDEEDGEKA